MANLFLGFPVPRAKIADMISGSAPPSLHKTQHQDGGTDEIDCTGLVGAGGITLPWNDLYLNCLCESLDGFEQVVTGSGSITIGLNGYYLQTGATADSYATIKKRLRTLHPPLSWDKNAQIAFAFWYRTTTSNTGLLWLIRGFTGVAAHFGFYIENGILYGTVHNGTTQTKVLLVDRGDLNWDHRYTAKAKYYAGIKVEFYLNDVLMDTITETGDIMPTGDDSTAYPVNIYIKNPGVAQFKETQINLWSLWQAA